MKKRLIALSVTVIMLLQILATPIYAIEQVIEDAKGNSQEEITEENQEEVIQEELVENEEVKQDEPTQNNTEETAQVDEKTQQKPELVEEKNEVKNTPILKAPVENNVIEIEDENLREAILNSLGFESNHEITKEDMEQLNYLNPNYVNSYKGLEYAINLQELSIYNTENLIFDFSILENMEKIERIELHNLKELKNIEILNNLPNLKHITIRFNGENELLSSNEILHKINKENDLYLEIGCNLAYDSNNYYSNIKNIAEQIKDLKVKTIVFNNLYTDIRIKEPILKGQSETYSFTELNPFLEDYILNENSIFYNEELDLHASREEIILINQNNKTITIKTSELDNVGNHIEYINYSYAIQENWTSGSSMSIYYNVAESGDKEIPIEIPDPELRKILHKNYDIDDNKIITEFDLININNIYFSNVSDLTGLENCINLESLGINCYSDIKIKDFSILQNLTKLNSLSISYGSDLSLDFDFSLISNMENLRSVSLSGINELTNVSVLNNLENLERIEFYFNNYNEIDKLNILNNKNNLILEIGLYTAGNVISNEVIQNVVDKIENFKIENVVFENIIQSINIGNIKFGEEITLTFDEISPWINYILTNKKSKLYDSNFKIGTYESNSIVIVNNNEKTVTIKPKGNEVGQKDASMWGEFNLTENNIYSISFSIKYRVIANGDTENEIEVKDENLKNILKEKYNFDGKDIITEYDMLNIEELTIDRVVKDLTGLEHAKNLKRLYIYNSQIVDLTPIQNLSKIEYLSLSLYNNNNINLECLKNMISLKGISLSLNTPFDISLIENLSNLNYITINASRINNIELLNNFNSLNDISLYVRDLDGVNGVENLLNKNEYMNLRFSVGDYNSQYSKEEYESFINMVKQIKIPRTVVRLNYVNIDLGEISENTTIKYEDLSPILKALVTEGPLYKESIELNKNNSNTPNNNNDVTIDNINKQIIINVNNIGNNTVYLQLGDENAYYSSDDYGIKVTGLFKIKYKTVIAGDKTKIIDIPDENFKNILERDHNLDGEPGISEFDMKNISELYLYDVKDITGIENAENLKSLTIRVTKDTDFTKLKSLTKLEKLTLEIENTDVDLNELSSLKTIKELRVYLYTDEQKIENLSTILNGMQNIEILYLGMKLDNINFVSNMVNLKNIEMHMPEDGNLTPLLVVDTLERLTINNIDKEINTNVINKLDNLTNLQLRYSNFASINGISNLKDNGYYLNINCYNYEGDNTAEEINILVNEINNIKINNMNLHFGINAEKKVGNICKNTSKTYNFSDISKILEEISNENSKFYNATINCYNSNSELQINNNNKTITINAGNEIGNRHIGLNISGKSSVSGSIYINYTVYSEEGSTEKLYTFKDKNLERILLENYNIDGKDGFSERDMLNLTEIELFESNIEDLSGLENAVNLKYIYAQDNKIKSLEPLIELEKLEYADLTNNYITDITCLRNRKFEYVDCIELSGNFINFSNGSENLKTLEQEYEKADYELTGIGNIAGMQKVGNPEEFDNEIVFGDSKIEQKLIELGVKTNSNGKITRRALYEATEKYYQYSMGTPLINKLDLSNLGISNISGLEYLGQIEKIDLSNNNISNIEPLKYLINLKEINLSNNNITDLSPFSKYIATANIDQENIKFDFSSNNITSIDSINSWICITGDNYSYNNKALEYGMFRKVNINLSGNKIASISGVENWKNLTWLDLSNNSITDVSNLKDYNFAVWPNGAEITGSEEWKEQLNSFKGIKLTNNKISFGAEETNKAREIFNQKNVPFILEDEEPPLPDFKIGDVDNNGVVNATDYAMIARYLKGYEELTPVQLLAADVDKNGTVNATDYAKIARFLKGYETIE